VVGCVAWAIGGICAGSADRISPRLYPPLINCLPAPDT